MTKIEAKFKVGDRVIILKELGNNRPRASYSFSIKETHLVSYKFKGKIKKRIEYILRPYNEIYNEKELMAYKK